MEVNEQLIRAITQAVVEQLHQNGAQPEKEVQTPETSGSGSLAGRTRMRPKHSYDNATRAAQGTDPREIVIGVGAAFQTEIHKTMGGIPLDEVLRNVKAGIEEEGMTSRVVRFWILRTYALWRFRLLSFPAPALASESSQRELQSFIRRICILFPIWSFFHRRLLWIWKPTVRSDRMPQSM